jgi:protein-tyrosine-phosphatase
LVHKARQFKSDDFNAYDYIIVMDESNLKNISTLKPANTIKAKVLKMRSFETKVKEADVPDPWFGGESGFEEVYHILKNNCQLFFNYLNNKKS